jgi:hypothetical protein
MTSHSFLRCCALCLLLISGAARADYLWLQRDGDKFSVYAGGLRQPLAALPVLRDPKPVLTGGSASTLETAASHYAFPATSGDARFTATHVGDDGVLTYFQARHGRAETKTVNDMELSPATPGGNTFRLFFQGRLVAASQVNVETSAGWRRTLTPDKEGAVTLETPFPGLYVLEISAQVNNGNVTLDGKKYNDVRYTATLSFEVGAP